LPAVYTGAIQDFPRRADRTRAIACLERADPRHLGRHDRFIPIKGLATTRAVYPHAEVLICECSGHLPMVEEAPLVAATIARFLTA